MSEQPHNADSNAGVEWGTPQWIVNPLAKAIGGFDLDPASGAEPKSYADTRYTKDDDGLSTEWFGHVWLNPPYGRKHNPIWAKRTYEQSPNCESITAIVPSSTSTEWWQKYYAKADVFCFIDTRVGFIGGGENSASFANVICVFDAQNLPEEYFVELSRMGSLMNRILINGGSIFDY